MTRTFRDFIWTFLPPFLRGEYGQRLMLGGLGLLADALSDAAGIALRSGRLLDDACGDDALQRIGSSRRMPRYPGESQLSYRTRLYRAWDSYGIAGSQLAIEMQFEAAGLIATTKTHAIGSWTRSAGAYEPAIGYEDASGGTRAVEIACDASTGTYSDAVTDLCIVDAYSRTCCFEAVASGDCLMSLGASGDVDGGPIAEAFDLATGALDTGWVSRSGHAAVVVRPVRGATGWRRYRITFAATGPAVTFSIGLPTAETSLYLDTRGIYAGPELVTVHTPFDWDREEVYFPGTDDEWWSRLWVFVSYGLHSGMLTTEQKAALLDLAKRWKDSHWTMRGVILEGTAPVCGMGLTCGDGAVCGGIDCEVLT